MTAIATRRPVRPITVLLVDDDPDCRLLLRDAIEQGASVHRVFEVSSGQEALSFLHRRGPHAHAPRPDLICLDLEMPGLTGHEVLETIKNDPELSSIPVVMLTGVDNDSDKRRAAEHGVNSYTLKPSDPRAFIEVAQAVTDYWLRLHQFPESDAQASGEDFHG